MKRQPAPGASWIDGCSSSSPCGSGRGNKNDQNHSPELRQILERLRPFQREAFEFATRNKEEGTNSIDDDGTTEKGKRTGYKKGKKKRSRGEDACEKGDRAWGCGGRILLADEMGLGKTVTSLAIMTSYSSEWPLLILCPASLRHTWPAEIEKFLPTLPPSAVYIVSGFDDADFYSNPHKRARIKIVIATYSLLQTRSASARVLDQYDFRCVIADESHNLKERNSQRCKIAMPLLRKARRLVLLSGTPALARPVELWSQLHCIDPDLFGSYTAYTNQYCNAHRGRFGWDVSGLSHADELHAKLRTVMVRRLKSEVLHELPPKQRSIVPVKIDADQVQSCKQLMEQLKQTRLSVSDLVGADARNADFEARRLLMSAYQQSGIGKSRAISEFLLDWLAGSGTQKVLVFAHHIHVLDVLEKAISKRFKGVGHIRIDGTVPPAERAVRVRKFQNSAPVRVALLGVTAAGVGLTLTAATAVIFAELHWTPGVLAQAEDRCHRIGQHNAVNVMYCVCKDRELSVDLTFWSMLGRKVGNLGRVIDGKKGASMNAKEKSDSAPGAVDCGKSGVSAEDELTSFFAETSPADSSTAAPKVPVKGSIQSFFQKKKGPSAEADTSGGPSSTSPRLQTNATTKTVTPNARQTKRSALVECTGVKTKSSFPAGLNSPVDSAKVTWTCNSCTFINTKTRSKGAWLSCEMCGTQHIPAADDGQSKTKENLQLNGVSSTRSFKESPVSVSSEDETIDPISQSPSTSAVVDICDISTDDDDINDEESTHDAIEAHRSAARSSQPIILEIDEDDSDDETQTDSSPLKTECNGDKGVTTDQLSFSVSKNTGRVAIHSAQTGRPLNLNFDVEQVVTNETSDFLLESKVKRLTSQRAGSRRANPSQPSVEFDRVAVRQVVGLLGGDSATEGNEGFDVNVCCSELMVFVSCYISLREVEKKALREWGNPVAASSVRQTLARIMTSTVTNTQTDRYSGGARERAMENMKSGTASKTDQAVLDGKACAWCAKRLSVASVAVGVESTYCSQKCAEDGRLRRGGMYSSTRVRAQVFGLEGGVCRKCGVDAHALFLRISSLQPAERLNALCNANWTLPKSGPALERILQHPKEGDFWQADHIVAVAEGGGGCGLDNLQTLCTPCHKIETDKLRARLRLTGGLREKQSQDDSKGLQMDIRSVFSQECSKSLPLRKKRRRTAD